MMKPSRSSSYVLSLLVAVGPFACGRVDDGASEAFTPTPIPTAGDGDGMGAQPAGDGDGDGPSSMHGTGGQIGMGDGDGDSGGDGDVPITGVEAPLRGTPEHYRIVRLTHRQWENAVQQVLLLPTSPQWEDALPLDPPRGIFANNENSLEMSSELLSQWEARAESMAALIAEDAEAIARLGDDEQEVLASVGKRAFRRELSDAELGRYQAIWEEGVSSFESGDSFVDGLRFFVQAILQSPHFLYRIVLSPAGERLSGPELATQASFLLHQSPPDPDLLSAAERGALDDNQGYAATLATLLESAPAVQMAQDFHEELYELRTYRNIFKNPELFPNYDTAWNETFLEADRLFFGRVFSGGFGIREILRSNVAYANEEIMGIYGLSDRGPELSEVMLDASRPGFLTRAGFLAAHATHTHPHPIARGLFIQRRMLCAELPSPLTGGIPPRPELEPGQTNRERFEAATDFGACRSCHAFIDPLGYAFEGFDALGYERELDNGHPIDTTGTVEGIGTFDGAVDLTRILADHQAVHGCYAARVVEYAWSRDLEEADRSLVEEVAQGSFQDNQSVQEMFRTALLHEGFTHAPSP